MPIQKKINEWFFILLRSTLFYFSYLNHPESQLGKAWNLKNYHEGQCQNQDYKEQAIYYILFEKKSQTCGIMNLLVKRQTAGKVQYMRRGIEVIG